MSRGSVRQLPHDRRPLGPLRTKGGKAACWQGSVPHRCLTSVTGKHAISWVGPAGRRARMRAVRLAPKHAPGTRCN